MPSGPLAPLGRGASVARIIGPSLSPPVTPFLLLFGLPPGQDSMLRAPDGPVPPPQSTPGPGSLRTWAGPPQVSIRPASGPTPGHPGAVPAPSHLVRAPQGTFLPCSSLPVFLGLLGPARGTEAPGVRPTWASERVLGPWPRWSSSSSRSSHGRPPSVPFAYFFTQNFV